MSENGSLIELLASKLADAWIENMTLSGRLAFERNDVKREAIINQAIGHNVWPDVYRRANEIMNGG